MSSESKPKPGSQEAIDQAAAKLHDDPDSYKRFADLARKVMQTPPPKETPRKPK